MALVRVVLLLAVLHAQAHAKRYLRSVDPLHNPKIDEIVADSTGTGSLSGGGQQGFHVEKGERQRPVLGPALRKWGEGYIRMDDMKVNLDAHEDVRQGSNAAPGGNESLA